MYFSEYDQEVFSLNVQEISDQFRLLKRKHLRMDEFTRNALIIAEQTQCVLFDDFALALTVHEGEDIADLCLDAHVYLYSPEPFDTAKHFVEKLRLRGFDSQGIGGKQCDTVDIMYGGTALVTIRHVSERAYYALPVQKINRSVHSTQVSLTLLHKNFLLPSTHGTTKMVTNWVRLSEKEE